MLKKLVNHCLANSCQARAKKRKLIFRLVNSLIFNHNLKKQKTVNTTFNKSFNNNNKTVINKYKLLYFIIMKVNFKVNVNLKYLIFIVKQAHQTYKYKIQDILANSQVKMI